MMRISKKDQIMARLDRGPGMEPKARNAIKKAVSYAATAITGLAIGLASPHVDLKNEGRVVTADSINVLFSPNGGCEEEICKQIDLATVSVKYQMYNFTSQPIADAMIRAKKRGCKVVIVVDKRASSSSSCKAFECAIHKCEVYLDGSHQIAHNKVRIIDDSVVVCGSYNDSDSASRRNAENITIIKDAAIAVVFAKNFDLHLKHSELVLSTPEDKHKKSKQQAE